MNLELWTKNEGLRAKNEGLFAVSRERLGHQDTKSTVETSLLWRLKSRDVTPYGVSMVNGQWF